MTYRSLKTFINRNKQPNNTRIFDLIPKNIKSKIIFVVGEDANNTAEYLSSIMSAYEIAHLRYTNNKNIDINKRFLQNSTQISLDLLCENAENILKACKKTLSNEDLLFCIALSFASSAYSIIEISEQYYNYIKDYYSPFALILTIKDDEKVDKIIDSAPKGVREIIYLSKKDNFDYVSNKYNPNGARITIASKNKIIISNSSLLGTSFYHYDYLYHVSTLNLNNISLAHLSIESARVLFSAPRPYIYSGLENAKPPHDLTVYSLSPTIILHNSESEFQLHHRLKFNVLNENDEFEIPTENTIFSGSADFLEGIKEKLKR